MRSRFAFVLLCLLRSVTWADPPSRTKTVVSNQAKKQAVKQTAKKAAAWITQGLAPPVGIMIDLTWPTDTVDSHGDEVPGGTPGAGKDTQARERADNERAVNDAKAQREAERARAAERQARERERADRSNDHADRMEQREHMREQRERRQREQSHQREQERRNREQHQKDQEKTRERELTPNQGPQRPA